MSSSAAKKGAGAQKARASPGKKGVNPKKPKSKKSSASHTRSHSSGKGVKKAKPKGAVSGSRPRRKSRPKTGGNSVCKKGHKSSKSPRRKKKKKKKSLSVEKKDTSGVFAQQEPKEEQKEEVEPIAPRVNVLPESLRPIVRSAAEAPPASSSLDRDEYKAYGVEDDAKTQQHQQQQQASKRPVAGTAVQVGSLSVVPTVLVGEGSFKAVYHATLQPNDTAVTLLYSPCRGDAHIAETTLQKLSQLDAHPNLLRLLGGGVVAGGVLQVCESFAGMATLHQVVAQVVAAKQGTPLGGLEEAHVRVIAWQLLQALHILHSNDLLHCDVTAAHLLVSDLDDNANGSASSGGGTGGFVKLADFALAKTTEAAATDTLSRLRYLDPAALPIHRRLSAHHADPFAQPVLKGHVTFSSSSDLYAAGLVCLHVLTGKEPFSGLDGKEIRQHVLQRRAPPEYDEVQAAPAVQVSTECKEFLEQCCGVPASARPSASELQQLPFFQHDAIHTLIEQVNGAAGQAR